MSIKGFCQMEGNYFNVYFAKSMTDAKINIHIFCMKESEPGSVIIEGTHIISRLVPVLVTSEANAEVTEKAAENSNQ